MHEVGTEVKRLAFRPSLLLVLLLLPLLLLASMPVMAQSGPTIGVEPQTVNIAVGSTFTVRVWIRNVAQSGLAFFEFKVAWNPQTVELINYANLVTDNDPNWAVLVEEHYSGSYRLKAWDPTMPQFPTNRRFYDNASWATLTYRCLSQADATIEFPVTVEPNRWGYWSDGSDSYSFDEYQNAIVHQTEIYPVGGIIQPVDKLLVSAPFICVVGLVGTFSLIYFIRRRKRALTG